MGARGRRENLEMISHLRLVTKAWEWLNNGRIAGFSFLNNGGEKRS